MKQNNTIDGECSGCGKCCASILPISKQEEKAIKSYIKKHHIEPNNRNAKRSVFDTQYIDVCPFLDPNNRCMIYEIRPEICRFFICSQDGTQYFNHSDKEIKNFLTTFFPKERCLNIPDIETLNNIYQMKKKRHIKR